MHAIQAIAYGGFHLIFGDVVANTDDHFSHPDSIRLNASFASNRNDNNSYLDYYRNRVELQVFYFSGVTLIMDNKRHQVPAWAAPPKTAEQPFVAKETSL